MHVSETNALRKVVVNVSPIPSSLLLALPKQPRKSQEEQAREVKAQLAYDLGDTGDRNVIQYDCPEKGGRGVKATRALKRGTFVLEYEGEITTKEEGLRRDKQYQEEGRGCYLLYFKFRERNLVLDATLSMRVVRLVNHSKRAPNLSLKVNIFIYFHYIQST
jgi:hypothetical protein